VLVVAAVGVSVVDVAVAVVAAGAVVVEGRNAAAPGGFSVETAVVGGGSERCMQIGCRDMNPVAMLTVWAPLPLFRAFVPSHSVEEPSLGFCR